MWKVTIRNPVAELYTTSGNVQKISHFLRSSSNTITVRPLPTHDASAPNTDSTADSELVSSVSRHRSVYRSKLGPVDLLSTSVKPLVDALNPAINMSRVALGLCRNPPGWVRRISYWENITALPPATTVCEDEHGSVQSTSYFADALSLQDSTLSFSDVSQHVYTVLNSVLRRLAEGRTHVSADLSGGVDSTVISVLLAAQNVPFTAFHAGTDDKDNRDTQLAQKIAEHFAIDLIKLDSFTKSTAGFTIPDELRGFSEAPRAWHANLPHLTALVRSARERGSSIHCLGIGGDELFEPMPVQALLYFKQGEKMRAIKAISSVAAAARWPKISTLRAAFSPETKQRELQRRLTRRGQNIPENTDAFSWFPNFTLPSWLSEEATEQVIELIKTTPIPPEEEELDKYRFHIYGSLEFQGEVLRGMNEYFSETGLEFAAPYLEDDMIRSSLVYPGVLSGHGMSKPVILEAMKGTLPEFFYRDIYKSDYSFDLYQDYERSKENFLKMIGDSLLAELNLVDIDTVRTIANSPLGSSETLYDFERMTHMEVWLRENYV